MFRKTRFNDRPELVAELKKEFAHYGRQIDSLLQNFLKKHPRAVFACMICSILLSAVLAFTVMRVSEKGISPLSISVISRGSPESGIGQTSRRLREVLDLQSQITVLLQQDTLRAADSLLIQQIFGRLEAIRKQENADQSK